MDDRIDKLTKAGMKITRTKGNVERLNKLTEEEVQALIQICKKLSPSSAKSALIYSSWPSTQPPSSKAS